MTTRTPSRILVPLMVVGALVVVEGGLRAIEPRLSGDIAHLDAAPSIVSDLVEAEGLRVLVAGNSLVAEGVDTADLESGLEDGLGRAVSIGGVWPDGTTPLEWDYLHRRLFARVDGAPDVLMLAFGPGHLPDRPAEPNAIRLARHHVADAELGEVLGNDLRDVESRSQFALARLFAAFGLRDRVATRVLAEVIPHYREQSPRSLLGGGGEAEGSADGAMSDPTFRHLENLLSTYDAMGTRVVLVQMPAPTSYEIEPGAAALLDEWGGVLVDVNPVSGITPERLPDGEHLDPEGRALFTEALLPALVEVLQ